MRWLHRDVALLGLAVLLVSAGVLPHVVAFRPPAVPRNLLADAEWSASVVSNEQTVLYMWAAPIALSGVTKVRVAATVHATPRGAPPTLLDEYVTIDLYAGPEYDKPEHDLHLTYHEALKGVSVQRVWDVRDAPALVAVRIFHRLPLTLESASISITPLPKLGEVLLKSYLHYHNWLLGAAAILFVWLGSKWAWRQRTLTTMSHASRFAVAGVLVIAGLAGRSVPVTWCCGRDVTAATWAEFTGGTDTFVLRQNPGEGFPITLEADRWYVATWQHRLCGAPPPGVRTWQFDMFGTGFYVDSAEHETAVRFSAMRTTPTTYSFLFNSSVLTTGLARFYGEWGDGVEIRAFRMCEVPAGLVRMRQGALACMGGGVLVLLALYWRVLVRWSTRAWHLARAPHGRARLFWISSGIVYGGGAGILLYMMSQARGALTAGLAYRVILVPALIWLFMFVLGWPIVEWSFGRQKRRFLDVMLAPLFGVMLASLTHTLSLAGVRPWWCVGLLLMYAVAGWGWHLAHHRYPVVPDAHGTAVMAAALLLFWIGMAPVRHQPDVTCFTTNSGDWFVYVMETQWQMEHSLAEAQALAARRAEPPYMSYFTYATTQFSHIGRYYCGVQSAMAMCALLTGTTSWQMYAYMSALLLALIPLSGVGALWACLLIRRRAIMLAALFLTFNHLPLVLQRDGYLGQVFALPMLIPITTLAAWAFARQRVRLALPVGLGLASIMSGYLVYIPVLVLPLGISALFSTAIAAWRRQWRAIACILLIGSLMGVVCLAGAPQKTITLVNQVLDRTSSVHSIRQTGAGGQQYPMRSPLYVSGVIDDWQMGRSTLHIPPRVFNAVSWALLATSLVLVVAWLAYAWRSWQVQYGVAGSTLVTVLLAWAYWLVPNRYVFFKSMGYVLPMFVTVVVMGWDGLMARIRGQWMRCGLRLFACVWIIWHVLSVVVTQMPHRFVTPAITGLAELDRVIPTNAVVRVNFGDMFLSPYVLMVLRHWPLGTEQPCGYAPYRYPRHDWAYTLEIQPVPGQTPVWSNGVYYLYPRQP